MIQNTEDIEEIYKEIEKIKEELNLNAISSLDEPIPDDLLIKFETLKNTVNEFKKFNKGFLEDSGVSDHDLVKLFKLKDQKGVLKDQKLIQKGDLLKCEILISEADFIHKEVASNFQSRHIPMYENIQDNLALRKMRRKKNKKKYRTMNYGIKWKKV
ncbi:hypothetical protein N9Y92_01310 [Chlamydiales bacterium]|nr:hypothetical protein [Chlamydiales bacterium]